MLATYMNLHSTIMLSLWSNESMLEHCSWFKIEPWNTVQAFFSCIPDLLLGEEVSVLLVGASLLERDFITLTKNHLCPCNGRWSGIGQKNACSTRARRCESQVHGVKSWLGPGKKHHSTRTYLSHHMWLTLWSLPPINYSNRNHELITTRPVKPQVAILPMEFFVFDMCWKQTKSWLLKLRVVPYVHCILELTGLYRELYFFRVWAWYNFPGHFTVLVHR